MGMKRIAVVTIASIGLAGCATADQADKIVVTGSKASVHSVGPDLQRQTLYLQTEKDVTASVGAALTAAIGFYPPGTYVRMAGGETAVAVQRGLRANTPWVIPIIDRNGMPSFNYHCLDTSDPAHAIAAPILFRGGKVAINHERVRRARDKIRR